MLRVRLPSPLLPKESRHALKLLWYVYFMGRRSKAEMLTLDDAIRPLYAQGLGCRVIAAQLRENPVIIYKRLKCMGIIRSAHDAIRVQSPVAPTLPFSRGTEKRQLHRVAIARAILWFSERQYAVSLPLEPQQYDLIVDSDGGLLRVQVKSTTRRERSGGWLVATCRKAYDGSLASNAGGRRRAKSYSDSEIDQFFVVTGSGDLYLLPREVVGERKSLVLDTKYAKFLLR